MVSDKPKVHMERTHSAIALLAPMLMSDADLGPIPAHITSSWLVEQIMALYQNTTHLHPVVHLLEHDLRSIKPTHTPELSANTLPKLIAIHICMVRISYI